VRGVEKRSTYYYKSLDYTEMYAADRKESMMAFVEKRVPDWTNVYEIISTELHLFICCIFPLFYEDRITH